MEIRAYKEWLHQQSCIYCDAIAPSEQSHIGSHGTSKRLHDENSCSMCHICHIRWHGTKVKVFDVTLEPFTKEQKAEIRQKTVIQFGSWLETLPIEKRQQILREIQIEG